MTSQHSIVVGLDWTRGAWQALDWAAEEAQHTGRPLLIVHVAHLAHHTERVPVDPDGTAHDLLARADTMLADRYPGVATATALLAGEPADVLVELSHPADLVVVGRGHRDLPHRLLGSVANRVLAHAGCPAVVVPDGRGAGANVVVVGVSDSAGGAAALNFAFTEAARRGAEVVAVRSWSMREWRLAASAALPLSSPELWETQERTVLDDCLRPERDAFPAVHVRTVLTTEPVEVALEGESESAAMLVLGCRRAGGHLLPRLGPISSWAAHHFDCPVVVVGTPQAPPPEKTETDSSRIAVPYLGDGT
jgi:nucleotide-binding universal stress UspA family protein